MKKFIMILITLVSVMTVMAQPEIIIVDSRNDSQSQTKTSVQTATEETPQKRIAVATFDIKGTGVTTDDADVVTELFIAELVSTGKVTVVDRANFDKIIKEMKFQAGDWSDKEKTIALGTSVNAEIIARGQVMAMGNKLYLSATVIDVKNATVISSAKEQYYSFDDIFDTIPDFCSNIIKKLCPLKIGDVGPGGGIVFYIEGNRAWECSELLGQATWDGANTMCRNYRGGGYSDWYLPTKDELNNIYQNLRRTGKIAGNEWYWSSSSYSYDTAWDQRFSDGCQYGNYHYKSYMGYVRAVRAFSN